MPPTPDLSGFINIKKDNIEQNCENQENRVACAPTETCIISKMPIHEAQHNIAEKAELEDRSQLQIPQSVQLEATSTLQVSLLKC